MPAPRPAFDLVVKVGGSLQAWRGLRRLLRALARLARRTRILVVPGGGRFADLVRAETARLGLDESLAHSMGLRAMDQYGLLLASLQPGAATATTLGAAARIAASGRLPILLAASLVEKETRLERSFRLTSDSIAAFLARRAGAPRLVLLKSTDGPDRPLRGRAEARRLARLGVVDPLCPVLLPPRAETWVLNGRRADQLARLSAPRKSRRRSGSIRPVRPPAQRAPLAPM